MFKIFNAVTRFAIDCYLRPLGILARIETVSLPAKRAGKSGEHRRTKPALRGLPIARPQEQKSCR
jgi:hypothetical protein